jgi:glycosidase
MNGFENFQPVTNGLFAVPVTLKEGENMVYVKAEDSRGYKSTSKNLVLTYKSNNQPTLKITVEKTGRQVTLTADAVSPVGAALTYLWSTDATNPASIFLNATTKSATVTIPLVDGEYYFNVRVRDSKNNRVYARAMVIAEGDSVIVPDINAHSSWVDDAIVYEIYPRSFSQTTGFNGVTEKIPYLKELGINTIWFMPIYDGPTTHGYEITNYYGFEEDYGTESDFKNMLAQLKANGIRVILDYVVNHTSVQHPFMQNVFDYKSYSPYTDFYIWTGEPGNSAYQYYFDWTSLPNLNHNNENVRKYFIDVAKYWVQTYGIDGYRCDVAWGVEERNNQFWQEWREALKTIKPEVFLEAEATSSDPVFYNKRFDSANDWDLRTKLLGVISQTSSIETLHQEVTRSYADYARPFRFVENHDENRVAQTFDGKRSLLAHTILFTLNGIPLIYSGGEVGEISRREMIDWTDPDNLTPSFKKLIQIRKSYIHNPVITRINNSDNTNVYSYSSTSENNVVVTAANFRQDAKNITLNISSLPFDGTSTYYLTDLMNGTVYTIIPSQRDAYPVALDGYQAKVFYYGLDSVSVGVDEQVVSNLPNEYKLMQNYPNPFNPTTRIKYQIRETEKVTLKIYDMLGREVKTLVDGMQNSGTHEVSFNASNLSSGIYFYQLKSANYSDVKKLIILK